MRWQISKSMEYNKREIPIDVDELLSLLGSYQPEDEYQALMEAPPHHEPAECKTAVNNLRDIVKDCIDLLIEPDKYIVEAINYEQVTYDVLGERLGVSATHAWRLKQIAYRHLAEILIVDGRLSKILR